MKKRRDPPQFIYQVCHLVEFSNGTCKPTNLPCRGANAIKATEIAELVLLKKYPKAKLKFIRAEFPRRKGYRQE